jgi:hypothetical protein
MTRPPVGPETEYSYVDKTTGRTMAFTPKPDETMFTFQGRATEDTLNKVLEAAPVVSVSKGFDLKRGFAAVYVDPTTVIDAGMRSLAALPAVANSIPVMVDANAASRYFFPDEFAVQFCAEVDADRAHEIIQDRGSSVVVIQRTRGYYTVAVPAGQALFETIREFCELSGLARKFVGGQVQAIGSPR